jgi:hypothetical protein
MYFGNHVRFQFGSAFEQQALDGIVIVIPGVAKRPTGGVDVGVRVSAAIEQKLGHGEVASESGVPKRHAPSQSWFFEFFKHEAFVHVGSEVE